MSRTWDTEQERHRKAEYRERKRLEEQDEGKPWKGLVGEEREQAIRDFYGYAPSETRTQAERQTAADRMIASCDPSILPQQTWNRQARRLAQKRLNASDFKRR